MTEIPTPPFADFDSARRFHGLLQLFLREVKTPGEPVSLHAFLLTHALARHAPHPATGGCADCGPPYPCATVLTVAALSRFPAPWTPVTLIAAMKAVRLLTPDRVPSRSTTFFGLLDSDPQISAEKEEHSGAWIIHVVERGQDRPVRLADDDAFVDHLLDMTRTNAFPFGWGIPEGWVPAVRPGVDAAREWWREHEALPYMSTHRDEGAP
ncbi:hypothetical protein [Allokutzneria multivorans]|uniref:hypothetical protein n=1 Tax=Allokutzneria multivorans TaxID=1142134 RepID=UPI0031E685E7